MTNIESAMTNQSSAASIYTDFAGLGKLKNLASTDGRQALEEVAQQFESIFLNIALKSMRNANAAFAEGSYFDSNQSRMYQDMLDQQLSVSLSEGQGMGLADVLVKQMAKYLPEQADAEELAPLEQQLNLPARSAAVSTYQAIHHGQAGL